MRRPVARRNRGRPSPGSRTNGRGPASATDAAASDSAWIRPPATTKRPDLA